MNYLILYIFIILLLGAYSLSKLWRIVNSYEFKKRKENIFISSDFINQFFTDKVMKTDMDYEKRIAIFYTENTNTEVTFEFIIDFNKSKNSKF